MLDRLLSILVALSLALLVLLYTRSRDQETLDNVSVPVKLVVATRQADHYSLEVQGDAQVSVTFSGTPARMRELQGMIQRRELQVVKALKVPDDRLDASRINDWAVIEPADLNAPLGVTVLMTEGRNRVPYVLHRLTEKRLPVLFDHVRSEPTGTLIIEPATVLVRGPREVLDRMQSVPTQPSELPTRPLRAAVSVAAIGRAAMVDEFEGRAIKVTPSTVMVRVPGESRKTYELVDVPITFLVPPSATFMPRFPDEKNGKLTLKVSGPIQDEPPRPYVFVDLTKVRVLYGLNNEPVQVQLPPGCRLEQPPPRSVSFDVVPVDSEGLSLPSPGTKPITPIGAGATPPNPPPE